MRIAIDARMRHGVATVVRNIVPLVAHQVEKVYVLGDPRRFQEWWGSSMAATPVAFHSPIYGIAEHLNFPLSSIRDCHLLHVPHFNVPARRLPFRLVVTINDVAHLANVLPITRRYKLAARLYYAHAVSRADRIITLSEFSKREIVTRLNVDEARISVIPCAVDHALFRPLEERAILETVSQLKIARPYLLVTGSVRPHKNIGRLVEAFSLLRSRHHVPHNLVIVGEREGFRINSELPKLPDDVHQRIRFTGVVADDVLAALYSGAEAFVMPSIYEGFGLPVLEAMACGVPVAVSRIASLPEVVGDAGVYFDPYSVESIAGVLHELVADPAKRKKYAAASLKRAQLFQWSETARRYVDVYASVVSAPL